MMPLWAIEKRLRLCIVDADTISYRKQCSFVHNLTNSLKKCQMAVGD